MNLIELERFEKEIQTYGDCEDMNQLQSVVDIAKQFFELRRVVWNFTNREFQSQEQAQDAFEDFKREVSKHQ